MPLVRKGPANASEQAPADAQLAVVALRGGAPQERWSAARSLRAQPGAAQLLGDALRDETDARVREAIFTSLARLATQESVEAVIPHIRSDDANLRTRALDALRAMIEAARPRLPSLLADSDPDVRILCCDLVRELPPSDAVGLLCGVLDRDAEPNVCAAAVDVLAEIGERTALPCLKSCAARFPGETFLSFAVEIAIERIESERADPHG